MWPALRSSAWITSGAAGGVADARGPESGARRRRSTLSTSPSRGKRANHMPFARLRDEIDLGGRTEPLSLGAARATTPRYRTSLSASRLVLMSAPSLRVCLSAALASPPRSEPARSMKETIPPPPRRRRARPRPRCSAARGSEIGEREREGARSRDATRFREDGARRLLGEAARPLLVALRRGHPSIVVFVRGWFVSVSTLTPVVRTPQTPRASGGRAASRRAGCARRP